MEKSATEMAEWRTTFDAKQKKRFKEQDKKMNKKLDAQTQNFDNKMDALATSIQEQLSTNQNSLQQMMQEQRNHLDAKIIVLLGSFQNMHATMEKIATKSSQSKINLVQIQMDPTTNAKSIAMRTLIQQKSWMMQMLSATIEMPVPLILVAREVLNVH
eukprot:725081-Ditylum_brightwellii.AAC.1